MDEMTKDRVYSLYLDFHDENELHLYVSEEQWTYLERVLFDPGKKDMRFISISHYAFRGDIMDKNDFPTSGKQLYTGEKNIIVNIEKIYTIHRYIVDVIEWYIRT